MEYIVYYGSWVLAIGAVLFSGACAVWYVDERQYSTNVLYPKMKLASESFQKAKDLYNEMASTSRLNKYVNDEISKLKTSFNEQVIRFNDLVVAVKDQTDKGVKANQMRLDRLETQEKTTSDEFTLKIENLTDRVWTMEKKTAGPTPLLDRAGVTKP